jgi:hypothetical protein
VLIVGFEEKIHQSGSLYGIKYARGVWRALHAQAEEGLLEKGK